jgi:hypothetical protein
MSEGRAWRDWSETAACKPHLVNEEMKNAPFIVDKARVLSQTAIYQTFPLRWSWVAKSSLKGQAGLAEMVASRTGWTDPLFRRDKLHCIMRISHPSHIDVALKMRIPGQSVGAGQEHSDSTRSSRFAFINVPGRCQF